MGRASLLTGRGLERALISLGVSALFAGGYFGVGLAVDPSRARTLCTAIDASIPFISETIWIYLLVFPASLLPLFVVRSQRLFRRAMAGYAVAIAASLLIFAAVPVTSAGLRVEAGALDLSRFSPWAVSKLYAIDPPLNLFPSLHLSIAALASLTTWKAKRAWGLFALIGVSLIAVSICTVKQHFVLDALGGGAVAAAVYATIIRPITPGEDGEPAYGPKGPWAFAATVTGAYAALYAWFRLGS